MEIFALYIWMKLPVITEIFDTSFMWAAWIFFILAAFGAVYWLIERVSFADGKVGNDYGRRSQEEVDALNEKAHEAYLKRVKTPKRMIAWMAPLWLVAFIGVQGSKMIPTQKETAALAAAYAAKVVIESDSGQKMLDKLKKKIDDLAD